MFWILLGNLKLFVVQLTCKFVYLYCGFVTIIPGCFPQPASFVNPSPAGNEFMTLVCDLLTIFCV